MSAERENFAQNPSRRAIFKAAPAIAAASAVSAPAVAIAAAETPMEWAYKNFQISDAKLENLDDDAPSSIFGELSREATAHRASICRVACQTENDLWLKVAAVLQTCGGLQGLHEQMDFDLDKGFAYGRTMAVSVIVDLVALRSKLVF